MERLLSYDTKGAAQARNPHIAVFIVGLRRLIYDPISLLVKENHIFLIKVGVGCRRVYIHLPKVFRLGGIAGN